jgi:DNA topoisomerase IB
VQARHRRRGLLDVGRSEARREAVSPGDPNTSLGRVDPVHASILPAATDGFRPSSETVEALQVRFVMVAPRISVGEDPLWGTDVIRGRPVARAADGGFRFAGDGYVAGAGLGAGCEGGDVVRLRTVSTSEPGWTRRRCGRGFVYLDTAGERLSGEAVEQVKAIVIPPAWLDVWICPYPNGHIQAIGTDAAGRRQYIYHQRWRERRDQKKFNEMVRFARVLPRVRKITASHLALPEEWRRRRDRYKFDRVVAMAKELPEVRTRLSADLDATGPTRSRVLALTVRLLDLGYFRLGSDDSVDDFGSYGLTTLERRHVRSNGAGLRFSFVGKSGVEQDVEIEDPAVQAAVDMLRRRRGRDERLLAYKDGRRWRQLDPPMVNGYVHELFGTDVTAKDFRTWHGTVIAATALADGGADAETKTARRRAVRAAVAEVAEYLGNTPAIARKSYVDPRVVDLYHDGTTIARALARAPRSPARRQEHLERAVLRMLSRA